MKLIASVLFSSAVLLAPYFCNAQTPSLDVTFNPGSGTDGNVFSVTEQGDGKVILGGSFSMFNGIPRRDIARLDSFGNLDPNFLPLAGPDGPVTAVGVQSDGKVLIGGSFNNFNSVPRFCLARLRIDGSLDLSYSNYVDNAISRLTVQSDGKVLIFGSFQYVNGVRRNYFARLNSTGTLDTSFNPAAPLTSGTAFAAAIQPDGNVILAGNFTALGAATHYYIARVDPSGNVDSSFDAGYIGGSSVSALAVQSDSKIILAGQFTSINGYSRINIARLNVDGSVDTTFVTPLGINTSVIYSLAIQTDGKLLVAGLFNTVSGAPRDSLARLNTDGSLDTTFHPLVSWPPYYNQISVRTQLIQPDGKILFAGSFGNVNGTNMNNVARLNADGINPNQPQFLSLKMYAGMLLTGTISNTYRIEYTTNVATNSLWNPITNLTLQSSPYLFFDTGSAGSKTRFYRMVTLP
jgi:uncharacterized delta-60 repeat protein